jgi:hypothetical protein
MKYRIGLLLLAGCFLNAVDVEAQTLQQIINKVKGAGKVSYTDTIKMQLSFDVTAAVEKLPYSGYPAFYLLDKQGVISETYEGYYKELESQLTAKFATLIK